MLHINVSFVLQDILEINEVQGAFVTKISTQREWFDNRLTYINLKHHHHLNVLSDDDSELVWSPTFVYHSIKNGEKVKSDSHVYHRVWNVVRNQDNNDFTALTPLTMSYEGPVELAEYFVKDIMICSQTLQNKTGISVVVTLGRPLINNIFTIFTPTILLLGIAHISRVFDKYHPDIVVMVCLTVILVQASL